MKGKRSGFTLIEMMVVVTIMVVMVAIGIISYSAAGKKNRDNRRLADLERIRMALEMFRQNDVGGSYPANASTTLVSGGYLSEWPTGPNGVGDTYFYTRPSYYTYWVRANLEATGVGYSVANP